MKIRCLDKKDCFANADGYCICLTNNDFGGRRCSFYKTKTKAATERKKVEKQLKYLSGTAVHQERGRLKNFRGRNLFRSVLRQYERLKRCRNIVNFLKVSRIISKMWADLSEVNFAAV